MERRMGPRERALLGSKPNSAASGSTAASLISRASLILEIKKFKSYPSTIPMDTKKALLLNLLLAYLNDPEILQEVWISGIDGLGKTLESQVKKP